MKDIKEFENKIICGDCREVMKEIPDNSIDLIVTSPPYNIGIDYDSWNDRMKWNDYWKFTKDWLTGCFGILKEDGRICVNHYFSLGSGMRGHKVGIKKGTNQSGKEDGLRVAPLMEIHKIVLNIGFKHHSVAIWEDRTLSRKTAWGSWLSASSPYINSPYEGILIMYKRDWKKHNKGKSTIDSRDFVDLTRGIWKIKTEVNQLTKANYPVELPEKCINLLSYENDIVLDPFIGSGTTAVACKKLNRRYIGIEISSEYCKVARKRVKNTIIKKKIENKRIFW